MNYSKEFQELVDRCQPTYIGTGNPNAKVLIIGKECAIDSISNRSQYLREVALNATDWACNIKQNTVKEQIDHWLTEPNAQYNPLYPYKGQMFKKMSTTQEGNIRAEGGTSATWYNYQKLMNLLLDTSDDTISLHEHSFLTEMNDVTGIYSNHISDADKRACIDKRSHLLRQSFFQNFPIVIVACGHYVRDYNIDLEQLFDVKWVGNTESIGDNWLNAHYQTAGVPKLVIHTNQLSMNISNELLIQIAKVCREFMINNNITI